MWLSATGDTRRIEKENDSATRCLSCSWSRCGNHISIISTHCLLPNEADLSHYCVLVEAKYLRLYQEAADCVKADFLDYQVAGSILVMPPCYGNGRLQVTISRGK